MAYIKNDELNEILSRADIVDIISSYLKVTPKGKNYVSLCPFHNDHSPSLIISREKQIFNCFTCRTGGNVFSFVMKYENVSFYEAVSIVAKKIGYTLSGNFNNIDNNKNKDDYKVLDYAMKFYHNNMFTEDGLTARKYLETRGITMDIIKEFNLGVTSGGKDTFCKIAKRNGMEVEKLEKLGLVNKINESIYDTFINRIIIPIKNLQGDVVGFTGRIFNGEDNTAKYLNTKETEVFKKGNMLFNYHNAKNYIRDKSCVLVVEGNMDAIKMSAKGFKNVVALMGVALSSYQADVLKRLRVPVILMLDNDSAGLEATVKNGKILEDNEIETKVIRLSGAKDPDEYIEKFGIDAMQNNIDHAIKYIDFKLEYLKRDKNLNNMEDLITYVKEVILSLSNQDDLTKEVIISKISNDYKIDAEVLKSNLKMEPVKKEVVEVKKNQVKTSKYHKASSKLLYYMLMDDKYINIYKNNLGYLKERKERVLASEIIYFSEMNGGINISEFTTYLMDKPDEYEFLELILSENSLVEVDDSEFDSLIKAILKIYKLEKKEELKKQIAVELDQEKKEKLIEQLIDVKRKCE